MKTPADIFNERLKALRQPENWGSTYLKVTHKGGVKITRAKTPPGKYEPRESFMGQITGTWRNVK